MSYPQFQKRACLFQDIICRILCEVTQVYTLWLISESMLIEVNIHMNFISLKKKKVQVASKF